MISTGSQNSVRTGGLAVSLLLALSGCGSSTESAHKPLVALPSWLGGSTPANNSSTTLVADTSPAVPPPAMAIETPATQPVITAMTAATTTATTAFVEHPSPSGATLSTMPTTVAATEATSPTTVTSGVAPMTVPNPTTRPVASVTVAVTPTGHQPAMAAADPNAGVVAHKPFIAVSRWFGRKPSPDAQPSVLLQQHARSDSPVPLSDYSKQPTHALDAFPLRGSLSAAELSRRLGPPAQLADYASPWYVYRLNNGRELWLHFAQPDEQTLLAADVIGSAEDGYTRNRVFSLLGMP